MGIDTRTDTWTIRRMEEADLERVVAIERESFGSQAWSKDAFARTLKDENAIYLTACQGDTAAGYCGCWQSADEGEIMNVAVTGGLRRSGIGSRLLEALFESGRRKGMTSFVLEVRAGNTAAVQLYQRLGFETEGVRRGFYEDPKEDALIMWKR